jgi:hypothetical protein
MSNNTTVHSFNFNGKVYRTVRVVKIVGGRMYSSVPEVGMEEVIKTYGLDRGAVNLALMLGGALTLSSGFVVHKGKCYDLKLTLTMRKHGANKVCCEVLKDYFIPETETWSCGVDFEQVDRFNILL